jgi:hypothetical protein
MSRGRVRRACTSVRVYFFTATGESGNGASGNGAGNAIAYVFRECIAYHWPTLALRIPRNSFPLTATIRVNQHEIKNNIDCAFPSTRQHELECNYGVLYLTIEIAI